MLRHNGGPAAGVGEAAIAALALAGVVLGSALTRSTAGGPTAASFSHQPPADGKAANPQGV